MRRAFIVLRLAIVGILALPAQEKAIDNLDRPLRLITRVVIDQALSGLSPIAPDEWAASLEAALIKVPRVVAVRRLPEGAEAVAAAAASAYDMVVVVRISPAAEAGMLRLVFLLIEASTGTELDRAEEAVFPPTEADLGETFWLPLASEVERSAPRRPLEKDRAQQEAKKLAGEEKAAKIPVGWTMESAPYMGQFADLWVGLTVLADRLRIKAGLYQFLFGLFLDERGDGDILVAVPLLQPGIALDFSFIDPRAPYDLYLSASAFARFSGSRLLPDPIAPAGTTFMAGAELRVAEGFSLFAEFGVAYYPFCDGFLMAVSKGGESNGPYAFANGDAWFLEYPQFRLGWRLGL